MWNKDKWQKTKMLTTLFAQTRFSNSCIHFSNRKLDMEVQNKLSFALNQRDLEI